MSEWVCVCVCVCVYVIARTCVYTGQETSKTALHAEWSAPPWNHSLMQEGGMIHLHIPTPHNSVICVTEATFMT
jgi:hypothetical protein